MTSTSDVVAERRAPTGPPDRVPWATVAFAALGGFCVAMSLPPWGWWPLAFVGTSILAVASQQVSGAPRRAALVGAAFAAPWMLMGMGWMWFLTVPGYLIAIGLFVGLHAAAAAVAAWAAPDRRWSVLAVPALHTGAEAVRMGFPFGGVPLATLGISQAAGWFLPMARVGGVVLLTWFVFQTGAIVAVEIRSWRDERGEAGSWARRRSRRSPDGVAFVLVVAALVVVPFAPAGDDVDGDPVVITAVQGGGEQGTSALDVPSRIVTERLLAATATIEPDPRRDVVLWPENGVDVDDRPFEGSDAHDAVAAEAARLGVPFLVGVTVDAEYSAHPRPDGFVNAHVVVEPDGTVGDAYEKVRIVPFGEYVPLRGILEALGAPLDRLPSDAVRGRDPAVIRTADGTSYGVVISWEVFFGDRGRAAADADVVVNPTNGASYTGTILQTQQIASSRLRAAETGRWVVQASPTGFSAFVSPDGEVLDRTDVSERAVIERAVPRRTGTTLYTRSGDGWWYAGVVALVATVLVLGRGRRQTGSNQSSMSPSV